MRAVCAVRFARAQAVLETSAGSEKSAGTRRATHRLMAAVMALIFVPALAAVLLMLGDLHGQMSISTILATVTFVALASGVIGGTMRMFRRWDHEEPHHPEPHHP